MADSQGRLPPPGPAVLVVAHPGHELRVYGWVKRARPRVYFLTDGSGRSGRSRLDESLQTLLELDATRGSIAGRLTDSAAYEAILSSRAGIFTELRDELAREMARLGIRYVVADAAEGYNPMHDVCRLVVNAALAQIEREGGAPPAAFDFTLVRGPVSPSESAASVVLRLDEATFRAKIETARRCRDLAPDVEEALNRFGPEAFRAEALRPVRIAPAHDGLPEEPPFYEQHGARQVAAGKYPRVLRRAEHVLPLARALWEGLA